MSAPRRTASPTAAKPREWLKRLFCIVFGLLAAVSIAEIVVRVLDIDPTRIQSKQILFSKTELSLMYCYSSNPNGEFIPTPPVDPTRWILYNQMWQQLPLDNIRKTPWCVIAQGSTRGIRDREFSVQPPSGTVRIGCVGDSFVFGEGVPIERTLPKQIETLLGTHAEVINFGYPSRNTKSELPVFSTGIPQSHCSRALLVFIPNDVGLTPELETRQKFINDLILIRDHQLQKFLPDVVTPRFSRLRHIIQGNLAMRRVTQETVQWYLDSYNPRYNSANLQEFERNIRALKTVPNCRVGLVLYPLLEGLEGRYPLQPIHDYVAGVARAAGVPVLDLAPAFKGQTSRSLWVHPADHHPNGKAHAIAARAIVDWLRRDAPGFLDAAN